MTSEKFAQIVADAFLESFTLAVVKIASDERILLEHYGPGACEPPHHKLALLVPVIPLGAAFPVWRDLDDESDREATKVISVVVPVWRDELPADEFIRIRLAALVRDELNAQDAWPPDLERWIINDIPPAWRGQHDVQELLAADTQEFAEQVSAALRESTTPGLEHIRAQLGEVIAAVEAGLTGATVLLHMTLGELTCSALSPSYIATVCRRLQIPTDAPREAVMRRIGREILRQADLADAQNRLDACDVARTATLREARAYEELRPDLVPLVPRADADLLADQTLRSETQRGHDLETPEEAQRNSRTFDEWMAETSALLEANDGIFGKRNSDDDEGSQTL